MALITKEDLVNSTFSNAGSVVGQTPFDAAGQFYVNPKAVGGELAPSKLTKDIAVKLDPLKVDIGKLREREDEETSEDPTTELRQRISNQINFAATPPIEVKRIMGYEVGGLGTTPVTDTSSPVESGRTIRDDMYMSGEYVPFVQPKADWGYQLSPTGQDLLDLDKVIKSEPTYYAPELGGKPVTALPSGHPQQQPQTYGMPVTARTASTAIPAGHPSAGGIAGKGFGQTLGAGKSKPTVSAAGTSTWDQMGMLGKTGTVLGTVGSAYTAYQAFKGGIDSPQEALGAVGGVVGTLGGLGAMGLLGSSSGYFAGLAAGPVGIGLMAAGMLAGSGIFGGGKSKPPMGGVEVRLADEKGVVEQYNRKRLIKGHPEYNPEGIKLVAGSASGYNGFDSGVVATQLQDNINYLYGFADKFNLKVNPEAWYKAAYGIKDDVNTEGIAKYMPRGGAGGRSVLEKIDSAGDGSLSPSEWLRHAMEYQSASGERILSGQIRGSQATFQRKVEEFNKEYWAA